MTFSADDESKVLLLWFKTLIIAESLIDPEVEDSIELIQSIHRFCKNLFDIVEETVYQGFLSFMRTNRKSFSERFAIILKNKLFNKSIDALMLE